MLFALDRAVVLCCQSNFYTEHFLAFIIKSLFSKKRHFVFRPVNTVNMHNQVLLLYS